MRAKSGFSFDGKTECDAAAEPVVELRPILFADLDGACLNDHRKHGNGYCGSVPKIVKNFNRVIAEADCVVVIVSAWRYLVHGGRMTVKGLEALLLTHGVNCEDRIVGVTRTDRTPTDSDRGAQVNDWLRENPKYRGRYAAVDDLELDYKEAFVPFVCTDSIFGLTTRDAVRLYKLLTEGAGDADRGRR